MSQVDQFLVSLKKALKAKDVTYKDLADSLSLSESSVKRILSNKSISLERIEEICKACEISFAEICQTANFEEDHSFELSKEQERVLSSHPRVLHFYLMLTEGMSKQEILKKYEISVLEVKKTLLMLDKLNLIELHQNDKIKMKHIGKALRFRREGEIGKVLFQETKKNYLNYDFNSENDFIRFSSIEMNTELLGSLKKRFEKLLREIQEEYKGVEQGKKTEEVGILVSYRPWNHTQLKAIKPKT